MLRSREMSLGWFYHLTLSFPTLRTFDPLRSDHQWGPWHPWFAETVAASSSLQKNPTNDNIKWPKNPMALMWFKRKRNSPFWWPSSPYKPCLMVPNVWNVHTTPGGGLLQWQVNESDGFQLQPVKISTCGCLNLCRSEAGGGRHGLSIDIHKLLVFHQPIWKICSSNWESSLR